jgi:hypothetical protein
MYSYPATMIGMAILRAIAHHLENDTKFSNVWWVPAYMVYCHID